MHLEVHIKVKSVAQQTFKMVFWKKNSNRNCMMPSQIPKKLDANTAPPLFKYKLCYKLYTIVQYAIKFNIFFLQTVNAKCIWLQCFGDHCDWSTTDLSHFIFIEYPSFTLVISDILQYGGYKTYAISPKTSIEGIGTQVEESWYEIIILDDRTNIHIYTSTTMNSWICRDEVLVAYVQLFWDKICNKFFLTKGNVFHHRTSPGAD